MQSVSISTNMVNSFISARKNSSENKKPHNVLKTNYIQENKQKKHNLSLEKLKGLNEEKVWLSLIGLLVVIGGVVEGVNYFRFKKVAEPFVEHYGKEFMPAFKRMTPNASSGACTDKLKSMSVEEFDKKLDKQFMVNKKYAELPKEKKDEFRKKSMVFVNKALKKKQSLAQIDSSNNHMLFFEATELLEDVADGGKISGANIGENASEFVENVADFFESLFD